MSPSERYRQLLQEIEPLPPAEQMERLLGFVSSLASEMPAEWADLMRMVIESRGTPEAQTFADVVEGQLVLRKIRDGR